MFLPDHLLLIPWNVSDGKLGSALSGSSSWFSWPKKAEGGFETCGHSPLSLGSRSSVVCGEGSVDMSKPYFTIFLIFASLSLRWHCYDPSFLRPSVHVRFYLNTPRVCNSAVRYAYKASPWLFWCMFLTSDFTVFQILNNFKSCLSQMLMYLLLFFFTQWLIIKYLEILSLRPISTRFQKVDILPKSHD